MNKPAGVGALLVVLAGGAILVALLVTLPGAPPEAEPAGWIGRGVWEVRGVDLAVQAFILLAGVFGILLVLGGRGEAR